ncbi:hypothetical protein LXL04_023535 [Taraxacum kok-saghyz]
MKKRKGDKMDQDEKGEEEGRRRRRRIERVFRIIRFVYGGEAEERHMYDLYVEERRQHLKSVKLVRLAATYTIVMAGNARIEDIIVDQNYSETLKAKSVMYKGSGANICRVFKNLNQTSTKYSKRLFLNHFLGCFDFKVKAFFAI